MLAGISSSVVSSQIVFQESKDKIVVFPVFLTKGAGPKEVSADGHLCMHMAMAMHWPWPACCFDCFAGKVLCFACVCAHQEWIASPEKDLLPSGTDFHVFLDGVAEAKLQLAFLYDDTTVTVDSVSLSTENFLNAQRLVISVCA